MEQVAFILQSLAEVILTLQIFDKKTFLRVGVVFVIHHVPIIGCKHCITFCKQNFFDWLNFDKAHGMSNPLQEISQYCMP